MVVKEIRMMSIVKEGIEWMCKQKGQPRSSQLIMRQNPPFGVRGVKGDQFIDKTPESRSKFVIHVVPTQAEKLDERKTAWELNWEDNQILVGKAFYLPAQ